MTRPAQPSSRFARSRHRLIGALCLIGLGLASVSSARAQSLSFRQRLEGMERLEQVYWSHRLWPTENTGPKPRLAEVLPDAVFRQRVQDVIDRSAELEQRWGVRITSAMLRAEMERMARETRNAAMLHELFDALDNDPRLIAECLARPILVDRLLAAARDHVTDTPAIVAAPVDASSFAPDSADVGAAPELAPSSGPCTPDTWSGSLQKVASRRLRHRAVWTGTEMLVWGGDGEEGPPTNTGGRYNPATNSWAVMSPAGAPSPRDVHTAVWTGTEMIVWGLGYQGSDAGGRYNPSSDTWRGTSQTNAPLTTGGHTAVWTGSKMVVWGGYDSNGTETRVGGIYDPSSDTWTATSLTNAPSARALHVAVWTGSRMIVWSGRFFDNNSFETTEFSDGGSFDPVGNTWTPISTVNAPTPRTDSVAVWTGSKMVVWGGVYEDPNQNLTELQDGGLYNPSANTWTPTTPSGAPAAREGAAAAWTGSRILIWGGFGGPTHCDCIPISNPSDLGAAYDPVGNAWSAMSSTNAPTPRSLHTGVWTGSLFVVWGGRSNQNSPGYDGLDTGARYNPQTDSWTATADDGQSPRAGDATVWTGTEMLVWGGRADGTGSRYNPTTNSWTAMSTTGAPAPRQAPAVWSGTEMIFYGGTAPWNTAFLDDGGRYNPTTDSWAVIPAAGGPGRRAYHALVWSGSEVLVWGGFGTGTGPFGTYNTGSRYNASTGTWTPMSATSGLNPRAYLSAVWTGGELIVWAGWDGVTSGIGFPVDVYSDGARYRPATDTWAPMTTVGAPTPRFGASPVWDGTEMVVWGGMNTNYNVVPTGGRYNPATNTWATTSTTGTPPARYLNTALWTGSEMLVWGGAAGQLELAPNLGGRYNPQTDAWAPMSTDNAPTKRYQHDAVWTGSEMIIFGGNISTSYDIEIGSGARYCAATCTMLTWYRDNDADGFGNPASTVSNCTQPVGYVANNTDCNDNDASVWAIPGETRSLMLSKVPGNVTLSWVAPSTAGATADHYDVVRSTSPSDFTSAATCLATNVSSTTVNDPTTPSTGAAFSYLSRAIDACGAGTLGTQSNGATRAGRTCP